MEAWGSIFTFTLREGKTSRPMKMSVELPCSKNGSEYSHYICCATSQQV